MACLINIISAVKNDPELLKSLVLSQLQGERNA
jgi:hypothetical protein